MDVCVGGVAYWHDLICDRLGLLGHPTIDKLINPPISYHRLQITPLITALLTLGSMAPALWRLWTR